jgi:HK97 family phage portal protein
MRLFGYDLKLSKRSGIDPNIKPDDKRWYSPFLWAQNSASGVAINEQTAMNFSAFYAGIMLLAKTVGSTPVHLYKRKGEDKERATSHQLYSLIRHTPCKQQRLTSMQWRQACMIHLLLTGNSYTQKVFNNDGSIRDLVILNPNRVEPRNDRDLGTVVFDYRRSDNRVITMLSEEIVHLRGWGFDGIKGVSPLTYWRNILDLGLAAENFGSNFFANSAAPAGVLQLGPEMELSDPARERLKADFKKKYSGVSRAGEVAILEEGVTWKQIGIPGRDAQFLESREFQIDEVARILQIPPHLLAQLKRCLPASSLVSTATGPKRIADIRVGDRVWSLGSQGLELSKVTNFWDNGIQDLVEVKTTNRTIRCTPTHKLLVRRSYERPLGSGEIGGRNVNGRKKVRVDWRNEYIEARDFRVGDVLVCLKELPDVGGRIAPNGRKLTAEFMEFCGLLLGDGNILKSEGKPTHVTIARHREASYMAAYKSGAMAEFTCGGNRSLRKKRPVHFVEGDRSTHFASVSAAKELSELGFSGTAFTKRVPGWVFSTACDLRLAILRGFLDADGTVDGKGRITLYSANEDLLNDFRHLCMGLGIPVTNLRFDDQFLVPPSGSRAVATRMYRFTCSDPGANRRIGSHDVRYIERLASGKPFDKKGRAYPRFGGKRFNETQLELSKIVSLRVVAAEPTFDIEVEGNHCFIADGIVSSNSTNNNIEHQGLEFLTYSMLPHFKLCEETWHRDLLESNDRYFFEFMVNGLVRGDIQTRYRSYAIGRQWGWLSINDIRAMENLNSIGDAGNIYLSPLNMVNADALMDEDFNNPEAEATGAPVSSQPGQDDTGTLDDPSSDQKSEPLEVAKRILSEHVKRAENRQKAAEKQPEVVIPRENPEFLRARATMATVLADNLGRALRKETETLERALRAPNKREKIETLYGDLPRFVRDAMQSSVLSYAEWTRLYSRSLGAHCVEGDCVGSIAEEILEGLLTEHFQRKEEPLPNRQALSISLELMDKIEAKVWMSGEVS